MFLAIFSFTFLEVFKLLDRWFIFLNSLLIINQVLYINIQNICNFYDIFNILVILGQCGAFSEEINEVFYGINREIRQDYSWYFLDQRAGVNDITEKVTEKLETSWDFQTM